MGEKRRARGAAHGFESKEEETTGYLSTRSSAKETKGKGREGKRIDIIDPKMTTGDKKTHGSSPRANRCRY